MGRIAKPRFGSGQGLCGCITDSFGWLPESPRYRRARRTTPGTGSARTEPRIATGVPGRPAAKVRVLTGDTLSGESAGSIGGRPAGTPGGGRRGRCQQASDVGGFSTPPPSIVRGHPPAEPERPGEAGGARRPIASAALRRKTAARAVPGEHVWPWSSTTARGFPSRLC